MSAESASLISPGWRIARRWHLKTTALAGLWKERFNGGWCQAGRALRKSKREIIGRPEAMFMYLAIQYSKMSHEEREKLDALLRVIGNWLLVFAILSLYVFSGWALGFTSKHSGRVVDYLYLIFFGIGALVLGAGSYFKIINPKQLCIRLLKVTAYYGVVLLSCAIDVTIFPYLINPSGEDVNTLAIIPLAIILIFGIYAVVKFILVFIVLGPGAFLATSLGYYSYGRSGVAYLLLYIYLVIPIMAIYSIDTPNRAAKIIKILIVLSLWLFCDLYAFYYCAWIT